MNIQKLLISVVLTGSIAFAADLQPNKTHAVLNVTYTNFEEAPQRNKKLVFVGVKKPKNKITVRTDNYGEATFHIPREDSYKILCQSLTGPFECGETPYVSLKASSGGITVEFDDTRAELVGVTFKAGSAELVPSSLKTLNASIEGLKRNSKAKVEIEGHTSSEGSEELNQKLLNDNISSYIDSSDKSFGFKLAEAEVNGIPVRIELGKRDIANKVITVSRRDTLEKEYLRDLDRGLPIEPPENYYVQGNSGEIKMCWVSNLQKW